MDRGQTAGGRPMCRVLWQRVVGASIHPRTHLALRLLLSCRGADRADRYRLTYRVHRRFVIALRDLRGLASTLSLTTQAP
jgi:hypothetical protein